MPFRFLHSADLHLDSPLRSLALRDPALAALVGNATRQALARIVDLCLDERVDALLLAGDLYDGEQTSMKTARFLAEQMKRLADGGVRVFVIRGNHDALSKITRELTLPEAVKVFGGRPEAVHISAPGGLEVAIHGVSFADSHAPDSLLPKYRRPVADAVNIGLMHTSLDGDERHDPYAPCALAELQAWGFHYWALGHIHARAATRGRANRGTVVMPGMPQGRDIGEAGTKTVELVTVSDDGSLAHAPRPIGVAEFARVAVDVAGLSEWRELLAAIEAALGAARDAASAEHLVARLHLSGGTPLAWRLRRDADLLREEVALLASGLARTAIDKVELAVAAPAAPVATGDPLLELAEVVETDVLGSADFRMAVDALAADLGKRLPEESRRALFGMTSDAQREALDRLAAEGAAEVLARLRGRVES